MKVNNVLYNELLGSKLDVKVVYIPGQLNCFDVIIISWTFTCFVKYVCTIFAITY